MFAAFRADIGYGVICATLSDEQVLCCLQVRADQANRVVLLHGCRSGNCVLNSLFPAGAKPTATGMFLFSIPSTGIALSETLLSLSGPACRHCRRLIPSLLTLLIGKSEAVLPGRSLLFQSLTDIRLIFLALLFRPYFEPDFGCRRQVAEPRAGLTAALP